MSNIVLLSVSMSNWISVHMRRPQIRFDSLKHSDLTSSSYTFCWIFVSVYHLQLVNSILQFLCYIAFLLLDAKRQFSWQGLYLRYSCIYREVTTGSPERNTYVMSNRNSVTQSKETCHDVCIWKRVMMCVFGEGTFLCPNGRFMYGTQAIHINFIT